VSAVNTLVAFSIPPDDKPQSIIIEYLYQTIIIEYLYQTIIIEYLYHAFIAKGLKEQIMTFQESKKTKNVKKILLFYFKSIGLV
jgi:hypothetical protein